MNVFAGLNQRFLNSGAGIQIVTKEQKARPVTIGGPAGWDNWGSGVKLTNASALAVGSGATDKITFEVAKSSGTHNAFFIKKTDGTSLNLLEGQWNSNRITKVDGNIALLNGSAYVFVAISSSKKAADSTDANTLATTLNVSALKPEAAPTPSSSTDPTPATGDFTAVYALVAVIACGVVVGSTVVLKKKED